MTHTPEQLAERVNNSLMSYSDKDWNYSRISLVTQMLHDSESPYVLWCEYVNIADKASHDTLKSLNDELKWGERHSNELGFLELVSLRLNKALAESTSDDHWKNERPVIRVVKRHDLISQGITEAFWYQIQEVEGDMFDNR